MPDRLGRRRRAAKASLDQYRQGGQARVARRSWLALIHHQIDVHTTAMVAESSAITQKAVVMQRVRSRC